MKNYKNDNTDKLMQAITNIESVDECYALFEDLCTIKEIQDMALRFSTAILLKKGESYQSVVEKIGTSSATICRINQCLNYGSGGYAQAIEKLEKPEEKNNK
ncbi:MAG: YerC/YecD family TrpR-related protein [Clostridia bacterium]|nr:YerC/YecD family TrpR-related protein [Clostridia bacterium]